MKKLSSNSASTGDEINTIDHKRFFYLKNGKSIIIYKTFTIFVPTHYMYIMCTFLWVLYILVIFREKTIFHTGDEIVPYMQDKFCQHDDNQWQLIGAFRQNSETSFECIYRKRKFAVPMEKCLLKS